MELTLLGAFVGGMLTLLSPCSVMLLPAFFSVAFTSGAQLMARIGVFYLGLITTLVPLGLLAGSLGALLTTQRGTVVTVASVVLVLLGLVMLSGVPLPGLGRSGALQGTSAAAVFVLGMVYGFAGACTGPLLGAVLTVAAVAGQALVGGVLLLVFAAGMATPLLVLALLWNRVPGVAALVRPRPLRLGSWNNTVTGVLGGTLTILIGVLLLLTDGTTRSGGVLGATDQFRLESWAMSVTAEIPDLWTVVAVGCVLGIGAVVIGRYRSRRRSRTVQEEQG